MESERCMECQKYKDSFVDEAKELYRYIPFERLVEIIETKVLYFANPFDDWDDKCEGYLYQAWKTEDDKIFNIILQDLSQRQKYDIKKTIESCKDIRAMSWSMRMDHISLWMAYSYNEKAVMIAVNKNELISLDYKFLNLPEQLQRDMFELELSRKKLPWLDSRKMPIKDKRVVYVENMSTSSELDMFEKNYYNKENLSGMLCEIIMGRKRAEFSFEKEVRLFISINQCSGQKAQQGLIGIRDINKLIEGVMVHPKATNDYVKIVENYCNNHNIKFLGKSKCLDFQ